MSHWQIVDEEAQRDEFRFITSRPTLKEAEAWIAEREKEHPEKVHRGGYGLDGPCPDPGETIVSEGGDMITGPDRVDPGCEICWAEHSEFVLAQHRAEQSIDQGKTRNAVFVCASCADGWNDGGDWAAPVVPL